MHLKPNALGLASAIVSGVGYILCAAVYQYWPDFMMKIVKWSSFNFDFTSTQGAGLTWPVFVAGLLMWVVGAYVVMAVFAWLYNKLAK